MSAVLKSLGFDLLTVDRHSDYNTNLGLINMARALADFSVEAETARTAVFYFAGHGLEVDGRNYLLPKDARLKHVRRMYFETVKLDDVRLATEHASHLRLIILDCCRDDPFNVPMRGYQEKRAVSRGLAAPVEPRGNTGIAYAAKHGTTASDGPDDGNSPFAQALIELLPTSDLDVRLLFGRIRDRVMALTSGDQEPHFYSNFGGQELFLNVSCPSPSPTAVFERPQQPAFAPQNNQQSSAIEEAQGLWVEFKIDETSDPELIEAYIRTIGDVPLMVHRAGKRLTEVLRQLKEEEERQWLAAGREDSRAPYETYANAWPSGAHLEQARKRINEIAEAEAWAAKGFVKIDAVGDDGAKEGRWIEPGSGIGFRDMVGGPEMVIVPSGSFMMGTADGEIAALTTGYGHQFKDEAPQHRVAIPKPFALGKYAVTRGQFATFVSATGHSTQGGARVWTGKEWRFDPAKSWRDPGFRQDDQHSVVCVNYKDAKAFADWLSRQTGHEYRLPTEAEWEYAARAGTTGAFWWGSSIWTDQANYDGNYTYGGGPKGRFRQMTEPAGSFKPNPWGLYQVHGNVWEWCGDAWHESYKDKPEALKATGRAWNADGGSARVIRGGSWINFPQHLRSAYRLRNSSGYRSGSLGFRVARTLSPL